MNYLLAQHKQHVWDRTGLPVVRSLLVDRQHVQIRAGLEGGYDADAVVERPVGEVVAEPLVEADGAGSSSTGSTS